MVQGLVIARALGPRGYGFYALALAFAMVVFLILDPRTSESVVRFLSEFVAAEAHDRARALVRLAYSLDVVWSTLAIVITAAAAGTAATLFHLPEGAALIVIVSLATAVAAPVATSRALLSVFGEFTRISRAQIVVAITRTTCVCAVALAGWGLTAIVTAIAVLAALESVVFVTLALRSARVRLGPNLMSSSLAPLRGRRREMLRFVAWTDLTSLLTTAIKQIDTLVVGALAGPREAGYYRLARSLTAPAGNVIGAPVQTIVYPKLARAESMGDRATADAVTRRAVLRVCLPLTAAALCTIPFVEPVLVLLAGEDFRGATNAAIALTVGVAISFATLHLRPMFLARDKVAAMLTLASIPTLVLLVVMVPVAATYGATGVAWARSVTIAIGSLMMIVYLRSRAGRHVGRAAPDVALRQASMEQSP